MGNIEVNIGHLHFNTLKEATAHFSAILNRNRLGEELTGQDGDDVAALFMCHPRHKEKLKGSKIVFFYILRNSYGHRGFYVYTARGNSEDFSIQKCINNSRVEKASS